VLKMESHPCRMMQSSWALPWEAQISYKTEEFFIILHEYEENHGPSCLFPSNRLLLFCVFIWDLGFPIECMIQQWDKKIILIQIEPSVMWVHVIWHVNSKLYNVTSQKTVHSLKPNPEYGTRIYFLGHSGCLYWGGV
jgi:hypothetical protein